MGAFCPKCQKSVDMTASICPHCGHKMGEGASGRNDEETVWRALAGPPGHELMVGHFLVLAVGTVLFLLLLLGRRDPLAAIQLTGVYAAFAAIVLGHGLLRRKEEQP